MRLLHNLTLAVLVAAAGFAARPAAALILPLTVSGGGIDVARTCTTSSCGTAVWTDTNLWNAAGTVTIDTTNLTLTMALSVPTFTISGAADNGWTSLTFLNTTYTATVPVTISGPVGGVTSYTIAAGQTAAVAPGLALLSDGTIGVTLPTLFSAARVTGQCGLLADNTGQCGFTFGGTGMLVPAPLSRNLRQTMNLTVVPEPGSVALLSVGLAGLAAGARRRTPRP